MNEQRIINEIDDILGYKFPSEVIYIKQQGAYVLPTQVLLNKNLNISPVLLPSAECHLGISVGEHFDLFYYLDSKDLPVATLRTPIIERGEADFLEIVDSTSFGNFADIGLIKHLFIPFKEQVSSIALGKKYAITVYLDNTGRLAGSMDLKKILNTPPPFDIDEWVDGVIWYKEELIGTFVILQKKYIALIPESEPVKLTAGAKSLFRVAYRHPDEKIEVSLRKLAHEEIEGDSKLVYSFIKNSPNIKIGDYTSPDIIQDYLGISKKAFKKAVGRLIRESLVYIDEEGHCIIGTTNNYKTQNQGIKKRFIKDERHRQYSNNSDKIDINDIYNNQDADNSPSVRRKKYVETLYETTSHIKPERYREYIPEPRINKKKTTDQQ